MTLLKFFQIAFQLVLSASFAASVNVPLHVDIWLAGFDSFPFVSEYVHTARFDSLLQSLLPSFSLQLEGDATDVMVHFTYSTVHITEMSFMQSYSRFIKDSPQAENGEYKLETQRVAQWVDDYFVQNFMSSSELTSSRGKASLFQLPFLILESSQLPRHAIYTSNPAKCSQTAVGSVAFVDMSARSCNLYQGFQSTGALHAFSLNAQFHSNWPLKMDQDATERWVKQYPDLEKSHFWGRLASVVTSSIHAIGVSHLRRSSAPLSRKIYIPIVILRCGNSPSPAETAGSGDDGSINEEYLVGWLKSLLPSDTEIVVSVTSKYIEESPSLLTALAGAEAIQTMRNTIGEDVAVHAVPFVNTSVLLTELAGSSGELFPDAVASYQNGQNSPSPRIATNANTESNSFEQKTSVAPVLVLEDLHLRVDLNTHFRASSLRKVSEIFPLLDTGYRVTDCGGTVVALHSSRPAMTYSNALGDWELNEAPWDMSATVAEGLSALLVGLYSPLRMSQTSEHATVVSWLHGTFPFHPFGTGSKHVSKGYAPAQLSSVISRVGRRNTLLSHACIVGRSMAALKEETGLLIDKIVSTASILDGLISTPATSDTDDSALKSTGGAESIQDRVRRGLSLPGRCIELLIALEECSGALTQKSRSLEDAFSSENETKVAQVLADLESHLPRQFEEVRLLADKLIGIIAGCSVTFHYDINLPAAFSPSAELLKGVPVRLLDLSDDDKNDLSLAYALANDTSPRTNSTLKKLTLVVVLLLVMASMLSLQRKMVQATMKKNL
jgi:hypothetical protein